MKRKLTIALALALLSAGSLQAQSSTDLGTWSSIQIIKSWPKTYAMMRLEHRSFDKISQTECAFAMAGAGYKFTPWLKGDLSYEYWHIPVSANPTTHKGVACLTGTLKEGALAFSLREKYEQAFNVGGSASSTLRSRIRAQYAVEQTAFTPYIMYEFFNGFGGTGWVRSLHYAGTEIKLSQHHGLDLFYMFHLYPKGGEVASCHLLGVGYVLSL